MVKMSNIPATYDMTFLPSHSYHNNIAAIDNKVF